MITRSSKRIKYGEGQWFGVPLGNGGHALGLIVRGNPKAKIALGYFFKQKFTKLPTDADTIGLYPSDAILITRFGDSGIVEGEWLILESTRPFQRQEWPVPKFARIDVVNNELGTLVEYEQNDVWTAQPSHETPCKAIDLIGLPQDGMYGSMAIEAKLTYLLG